MNKRTFLTLLMVMLVMTGWMAARELIYRWHPEWRPVAATEPAPTTQPAASQSASSPATKTVASSTQPTPIEATTNGAKFRVMPATMPAVASIEIGADQDKDLWPVQLTIDSYGAGLHQAVLKNFTQDARRPDPFTYQQPLENGQSFAQALATRWISINGEMISVDQSQWRLEKSDHAVTCTLQIADSSGAKALSVTKTFTLQPEPKDAANAGKGYEIALTYQFENQTGQPMTLAIDFNGTNAPSSENRNDTPSIITGFRNDQGVVVDYTAVNSFGPKQPEKDLKAAKPMPILWTGMTSAYFNALIQPSDQNPAGISLLKGRAVNPEDIDPTKHSAAIELQTEDLKLAAGAKQTFAMNVFLGPKERSILKDDYFASFPRRYDLTLVLTTGFCGYCTFNWLIDVLVWMLWAFHLAFRDWGISIIVLVLLVRLLLHPITKKSQIMMSKMTKMGPEMERLKKKYADQPDELKRQQQLLIKEQGMTPILGCLPMLLQMPIWIALWQSLQTTFDLRHASFLWHYTWIKDLSQPDQLVRFGQTYSFLFLSVSGINLLPILMGVIFYLQQKYTPQAPAASPEAEAQQKMMKAIMPLLFPLMLYTGPAGLNLYILASTGIGIIESKRIRDHIKEREEADKAGRVIIDAPATRAGKRLARDQKDQPEETKAGCLGGFMANLQKKAEEMQKNQQKGKGRK